MLVLFLTLLLLLLLLVVFVLALLSLWSSWSWSLWLLLLLLLLYFCLAGVVVGGDGVAVGAVVGVGSNAMKSRKAHMRYDIPTKTERFLLIN